MTTADRVKRVVKSMSKYINKTHDCGRGSPVVVEIPLPPGTHTSWVRCRECDTPIPVETDSL